MDSEDIGTNPSGNRAFAEVVEARFSRRNFLSGGLAAAAVFVGGQRTAGAFDGAPGTAPVQPSSAAGVSAASTGSRLIGFTPVSVADGTGPLPSISPDYEMEVILPWGDPIIAPYPEHTNGLKTAEDQEKQIGIGHDGMWFFPINGRNHHGLLCINHEFGRNSHVLGKDAPESLEDVRLSQAAHGVSVIEIRRISGRWTVVRGVRNRRIHVNTRMEMSGPVAGHALLGDPDRPVYGTVNNCASGPTPYDTYVTCEENFNGYFAATGDFTPTPAQERYGINESGFRYGWEQFDSRFDLTNPEYAGEDNRFGWCVEIDPHRPGSTPMKRTAMGRFKHEGVTFVTGNRGRLVGYMGDDQRFDYIYRYVSDRDWKVMRLQGVSPLDEGQLYVARFDDDGTGEWLELTIDNPVLAEAFADQAEVLTYARMAADLLGATPMDRPEWTTVARNGDVYCTLTNNGDRETPNAANPLAPNSDGHIIKWRDSKNHTGSTFEWDIFIFAEDTHGTEDTFSDPDGVWADPEGRLFVETDGGQMDGLNNQIMVIDIEDGHMARLLTGVTRDEITGLTVTPNRKTMFANTQHPGNGDPELTNFPVMNDVPDGVTIPRDATYVITKKDGGIIGS